MVGYYYFENNFICKRRKCIMLGVERRLRVFCLFGILYFGIILWDLK